MRRTLFYVPPELFDVAGSGIGWLLIAWIVFSIGLIVWLVRQQGWNHDTASYLPLLTIMGLAIWLLLPNLQLKNAAGEIVGLPIRGYGMMVMLGILAGFALAAYRARQMGIHFEVVSSLAFVMFLAGFLGARAFYVIQNWEKFIVHDEQQNFSLVGSLVALVNVMQGGLVVYGSVIGGFAAGVIFLRIRKLPVLAVGDIIAPSLFVGLALGRIGCLLNGCCFGGLCSESAPFSLTFPRDASPELFATVAANERENTPPYAHQREFGLLHGIRIQRGPEGRPVISQVDNEIVRNTLNNGDQLAVGDVIQEINGYKMEPLISANGTRVEPFAFARQVLGNTRIIGKKLLTKPVGPSLEIKTADGRIVRWSIGTLPEESKPVYPAQIYSAINAGLLATVLWFFYAWRSRDGQVIAIALSMYPITRWLLEVIRDDEPGRFGTAWTISQWISVFVITVGFGLLLYTVRQPKGTALPLATTN